MNLRGKWLGYGALAILVIVLIVIAMVLLRPPDPASEARALIARLQPDQKTASDALITAGADPETALALWRLGPEVVPVVADTIANHPCRELRGYLALVIGLFDAEAEPAVPTLIAFMDADGSPTLEAVVALGRIGPSAAPAVPRLVPVLAKSLEVDYAPESGMTAYLPYCVETLGLIGPKASAAVPALTKMLNDPKTNSALRSRVARALTRITGKRTVSLTPDRLRSLVADLRRDEGNSRGRAMQVLYSAGWQAEPAVDALAEIMQDGSQSGSAIAAQILSQVGRPAAAALIRMLRHEDPWRRAYAARALRDMEEPPPEALAPLRKAIEDEDPTVSHVAEQAVGTLEGRYPRRFFDLFSEGQPR